MRYLVYIFFALSTISYGQEVTKATSQGWAGGMCCRTGINYVVNISLPKPVEKVELKAIFLRGEGLIHGGIYSPGGDNQNFQVNFGTSEDYSRHVEQIIVIDKNKELLEMPYFSGEALIILLVKGKEVKVEVDGFEALPYVAYP